MVFVLLAWSDIAVRATGFWKRSLDVAETRLAAAELSQARWSAWARDMSWILGTFLGLSPTLKKEISPITTDTLSVAATAAAAAKPLQSCLTLCDPIDGSPPGESLRFSRQEHYSSLISGKGDELIFFSCVSSSKRRIPLNLSVLPTEHR